MKKLGLIQSRGIGDIIIALPIARYYAQRGWHVVWPIDQRFLSSFAAVVDYVEFRPFAFEPTLDGFLMTPMRLLKAEGCEKIVPLYSCLSNTSISNQAFFHSLKFDEYKYAVAGVPFGEKWNLFIKRDAARERALYDKVVARPDYIVVHRHGSNVRREVTIPPRFRHHQIVEIGEQTENLFDWLLVLERAKHLFLIDSCFSNLVEQLGLPNEKTFILRSEVRFTPVLRSSWSFYGQPESNVEISPSPPASSLAASASAA